MKYFLRVTIFVTSDFDLELLSLGPMYDQKARVFEGSNSKRFRKGMVLPCRLSGLAVLSKNVSLVSMKKLQNSQKVGKVQYINLHFPGNHFIQTNFTFLLAAVKIIDLHEHAAAFQTPYEVRIPKIRVWRL